MSAPRLLDLFCCQGGAGMGYHRAGFEVVGVDLNPQPNYPFEFHQGDALEFLDEHWREFDAIHASPPCQAFTAMGTMPNARQHLDLLTPTRERLAAIGKPYAIENVPGAPMDVRAPDLFGHDGTVELCGSMFGLRTEEYELRRHRWFESNVELPQPLCRHSSRVVVGFYGDHARTRRRVGINKDRGGDIVGTDAKLALVRDLMGIDWMTWSGANQAIPPAYTEFIGAQLLDRLAERVA